MKKALTILAAGLMLGAFAASQAKLPPSPRHQSIRLRSLAAWCLRNLRRRS